MLILAKFANIGFDSFLECAVNTLKYENLETFVFQIGPIELPRRLNRHNYLAFLRDVLPWHIARANIPIEIRPTIIFMHDGCPVHFARIVREHLDDEYGENWIGRGGPIAWPPRSPDFNVCDYFLWGYAKNIVYQNEVPTREDCWTRLQQAFASITQEMARRATRNVVKRMRYCIRHRGAHIQQNLHFVEMR